MRYFILIIVLFSSLSWAETSADRVKMYFSDIENGKYSEAAGHFDPSELKEFRQMMSFFIEIPPESQAQFLQAFFGAGQTVKSVENLTDIEFFSGLFSFFMREMEAVGGLSFDGFEILGEVKEGKNISHVVMRNQASLGGIEIETMDVLSLKKFGNEWRILMSSEMKGLPQQLKAAF